jgi:hypothetical protein
MPGDYALTSDSSQDEAQRGRATVAGSQQKKNKGSRSSPFVPSLPFPLPLRAEGRWPSRRSTTPSRRSQDEAQRGRATVAGSQQKKNKVPKSPDDNSGSREPTAAAFRSADAG